MRLDIALTTGAVGRMVAGEAVDLVGEKIEDTESLRITIYRQ